MRVLIELWPALLPLLLYVLWMGRRRRHAVRQGQEKPSWREGPWFWAVLASIAVAIACLILFGLSASSVKGTYVPPHLEDGRLVPGKIEP